LDKEEKEKKINKMPSPKILIQENFQNENLTKNLFKIYKYYNIEELEKSHPFFDYDRYF
jgi:hypothetical protein